MPLSPGTRLGHSDATALLGEGGMGEVCRAHDRKLGRDVALKVLPDLFADDPERLARFQNVVDATKTIFDRGQHARVGERDFHYGLPNGTRNLPAEAVNDIETPRAQ